MPMRRSARALFWLGLSMLLTLAVLGAASSSTRAAAEVGACYCRGGSELNCLGLLTQRECDKQCADALCDDWFWLERRACWNWGYGG
jgi:hypothetical protein